MNIWLKNFFLMALMVFSAISALALTPTKKLSQQLEEIDLEQAVPNNFGQWKADTRASPIMISAETQDAVAKIYDQTLNRTYINDKGESIMLSIAYGGSQSNQLRAHRQEVCYAAQGFQISQLQQVNLQLGQSTISGTRMVAQQGQRTEPVTYWFTMGDSVVRSFLDRQLTQLKYAFSGFIPDGYLFRVSSITADSDVAFRNQQLFTEDILLNVDKRLADRLLGKNNLIAPKYSPK